MACGDLTASGGEVGFGSGRGHGQWFGPTLPLVGQRALAECVFTAAVSGSAPVRVIVPVVVFGSLLLMCSIFGGFGI